MERRSETVADDVGLPVGVVVGFRAAGVGAVVVDGTLNVDDELVAAVAEVVVLAAGSTIFLVNGLMTTGAAAAVLPDVDLELLSAMAITSW